MPPGVTISESEYQSQNRSSACSVELTMRPALSRFPLETGAVSPFELTSSWRSMVVLASAKPPKKS